MNMFKGSFTYIDKDTLTLTYSLLHTNESYEHVHKFTDTGTQIYTLRCSNSLVYLHMHIIMLTDRIILTYVLTHKNVHNYKKVHSLIYRYTLYSHCH